MNLKSQIMKNFLRFSSLTFAFVFLCNLAFSQNSKIEVYIQSTGVVTIEDDGEMLTFDASTDDAEQENDAVDTPFDDDIDAGWEGAPEDQNILTAGLRFRDIYIPKGATIDSAFIIVNSHEGKDAEDVAKITINAEAADSAYTFDEANFNDTKLLTDRPMTSASVLWTVDEPWELWGYYSTPDIKDLVQEVVDRGGWKMGNAIAFYLQGEDQGPSDVDNAREFEAYENIADPADGGDGQNHPERRPKLVVYYTADTYTYASYIQSTGVVTIEDDGEMLTFDASTDDAEQENDAVDTPFDDDIDAGWEGAPEDQNTLTAGLRFRNVTVPQGAMIESAYIIVNSHEGKDAEDIAKITITAEATDSAYTFDEANFNDTYLLTDRPMTSASVLWTVDEPWGLWEFYQTPDLADVVQEVVDRSGWKSGNAIAFILAGEDQGPSDVDNAREFEAYENIADPADGGDGQNHPERRAQLFIHYKVGPTSIFTRTPAGTLRAYPNPAKDQLTVELKKDAAATIELLDITGKVVLSQNTNNRISTLNISNVAKGIYIIKAVQESQTLLQKMIIE